MGEFYWRVGVCSADGERMETVDALVDTGSSYSLFPRSMLGCWESPSVSS